jgi:exonuclease III
MRIGTLNIDSMARRGKELADMMERRNTGVLCVQETRWKGKQSKGNRCIKYILKVIS